MISVQKEVFTLDETMDLAKKIVQLCQFEEQVVLLLDGDLGAGKTAFTKGVAQALNIPEMIKSPTYTLVKEYTSGDKNLYHFDVYRLEDMPDADIGIDEYFEKKGFIIIEWSQFISKDLPNDYLRIIISRVKDNLDLDDNRRIIELCTNSSKYINMLNNI